MIEHGYGFSFFGTKGYTFSPVFARDHIIVRFSGHFVNEVPEDKFTIVLKKVKGEDAVPLFQTLTFRTIPKQEPVMGSHLALFEMSDISEYLTEGTWKNVAMLWYLLISAVSSLIVCLFIRGCRKNVKGKECDTLQAFSYDNGLNDGEKNIDKVIDVVDEPSTASYSTLSGNNKTPALF